MKSLVERLTPELPRDIDTLLDVFVDWAKDSGLTLYSHQEEAILEVFADRHVVLNTPTGSGKSLVALAMHFKALATGRRSFYTSPIKALVSEKFFELCRALGGENVGMMTGDAAINRDAPVICCTAEILAAMALSEGERAQIDDAILDEFHFYGDRERGMAWQIPLLALPRTTFMLMSATLGDTRELCLRLKERTGREVSLVRAVTRPVPLEFEYSEEPLHEAIIALVSRARAPIYVVSFTQRDCAERVQDFTSLNVATKEDKAAISEALSGFRFDTPYGKDVQRFIRSGLALHHAGLLPKYRLLVERLAQRGLLKIICGTDTLGVGINVPLRTVLFTQLCKFDGQKTRLLTVRDFHQIAGRAGRKGFDDRGWVVCQAPEHVIENKRTEARAFGDPKKQRKIVKKKPPEKGYVPWDEKVYRELIEKAPEPLTSRFKLDYGMLVNLLQRPRSAQDRHGGYGALVSLIALSHESPAQQSKHRHEAKRLFVSLRQAGVIELRENPGGGGQVVGMKRELQRDFSLNQSLSLFLFEVVGTLSLTHPDHAVRVLTFVESIVEDPVVVLLRQQDKARKEEIAVLKAAGVEFDQRIELIEKVTYPMPDAELVFGAFEDYAAVNPWVRSTEVRPKSVARDMYLRFASFNEYVVDYSLQPSEGVLLRYLSQVYKALVQAVPDAAKNDELFEIEGYLRSTLERADSSLLSAWEDLVDGQAGTPETPRPPKRPKDALFDRKVFASRVRAELHAFVKALSLRDYDEAAICLRPDPETPPETTMSPALLENRMRAFYAQFDRLIFDTHARGHALTSIEELEPRLFRVRQVLCDDQDEHSFFVEARINLVDVDDIFDGPLLTFVELGE